MYLAESKKARVRQLLILRIDNNQLCNKETAGFQTLPKSWKEKVDSQTSR